MDDVISPHSVKFLTHRGLPYRLKTEKISYKVTDMNAVKNALDEQRDLKLRYVEHIQVPTPHSSLVISEGEGHCTREMEIIYWPKLYPFSKHYKFQL